MEGVNDQDEMSAIVDQEIRNHTDLFKEYVNKEDLDHLRIQLLKAFKTRKNL